jgi:SAUR family protein
MVWRKKSSSGADEDEKIPKGHVPMVTGNGDGEQVLMPVRLLSDPSIAELLDMAAQQYRYQQPGVLEYPNRLDLAVCCMR